MNSEFSLRIPGNNAEIQYKNFDNAFKPSQKNHPHNPRRKEYLKQKRRWLLRKLAGDIEKDIENSEELRQNLKTAKADSISTFITEYEVAYRLITLGFSLKYEPDLTQEVKKDNPKVPDFEAKKDEERFFVEAKTRNKSKQTIQEHRFLEEINSHLESYNRGFKLRLTVSNFSLENTSEIAHKIIQKLEGIESDDFEKTIEEIILEGENIATFKILGTRSDDKGTKAVMQTSQSVKNLSNSIRSILDAANQKDVPDDLPLLLFCKLREPTFQDYVDMQVYGDSPVHIVEGDKLETNSDYIAIEGEKKFGKFNSGSGSISTVSGAIFYNFIDGQDRYYRNQNAPISTPEDIISKIVK